MNQGRGSVRGRERFCTTADRYIVSRSTYNMSIDIQYVDRHTHHVCRLRHCMSIEIYMSIDIHAVMFLDRHTVLRNSRTLLCRCFVLCNAKMENFGTISKCSLVGMFLTYFPEYALVCKIAPNREK